ncbi:hypothetical protein M4951_14305 [Blastopirellula sp. J2-11]|uniref:hypothetical protein n=1 Tax=Blastopirellula sp. J2-11 TaxID=2943192 RepID=UPI0021C7D225|nr:hypothetical protein [Blastopirellula sp. J2-11]UUO04563.1 hypothetical protein M4951_14305 [Blastopirellula sp. J2-11]
MLRKDIERRYENWFRNGVLQREVVIVIAVKTASCQTCPHSDGNPFADLLLVIINGQPAAPSIFQTLASKLEDEFEFIFTS